MDTFQTFDTVSKCPSTLQDDTHSIILDPECNSSITKLINRTESISDALQLDTHNSADITPFFHEESYIYCSKDKCLSARTITDGKIDLEEVFLNTSASTINQKIENIVTNKRQKFDTFDSDLNARCIVKLEGSLANKENIQVIFPEGQRPSPGILSITNDKVESEIHNHNPELVSLKRGNKAFSQSIINTKLQGIDKKSLNIEMSAGLANINQMDSFKLPHSNKGKDCNSILDKNNTTGLVDTLLADNVKLESVFINGIQMAPNKKIITGDSKSQISESSQSNFSAVNERQLVTNIKVEKNINSAVQKEFLYHFPKDNVKEISFFNQQESKINKNMLPISNIKFEVTNFAGKNYVQCKGLQNNNNITDSNNLITNLHETEFNKYPCSAVGNYIDSNSDVILMKVECDEFCGSSNENLDSVGIPRTDHSDTNVYITKNTEFHSQNAETFDHCLQSDTKGLSIAKDVEKLSPIRCKKNSLDSSSCCNALNWSATNDSLKEKSNKLLNAIENKRILCSDEPKYWSFGIPMSSVDVEIEAAISPNGKAGKTVHSEMLNPVVSRCINNIPSALLNMKTENIEDDKMLNSDVSQYCANDVPSVSLNIKTEKTVSSEISNSDVTKCCINDIPPALQNIKTEKIVDSESSNCNDADYCINNIPSTSMNISNEKTEGTEELNCDIQKNCTSVIPPVSLNIKTEKTEDIEALNCDISKNCIIPPVLLNIKTEASSSFVSKENCNVKIIENSSNTHGLNHKRNLIGSFKNIQFSSKKNDSNEVVLDRELSTSTSKVNVLSMSTATDGINKSDITSSFGNFNSEGSSNYVGEKSNDPCKNKKISCGENSEQCQLTYIENNIFRLASSSLCPVTKDKHPKLVLQSYKCHKCNVIFYFEKHYHLHQLMHENSVYDKQFKKSGFHLIPSEGQDHDSKNEDFLNKLKSKHHRQEAKVSVLKKILHPEMNNKMLLEETVITYKCELCDEKFNVQSNYQSHQIPQQQPKFKCVVCSKDFESSSSCKSHEKECPKRSHSESEEESCDECHICGYKPFIHSSRTLKQHMLIHSTERPFKCNQCEKTFTNKKNLRAHQQNHKNGDPVTCKICGKSYKNKTSLYSHSRTHKSLSKECHLCDAKFVNLTDLKKHYTKHTGEKPYSCDICDKSFRAKKVLEIHLSVHCDERYLCEFCGKELRSKHHLVRHKSVHLNGKQFKCKICSKMFNYENNLKQHLLTHSDKRTHACKLCNKKFKRPHHLRQHQQTHL